MTTWSKQSISILRTCLRYLLAGFECVFLERDLGGEKKRLIVKKTNHPFHEWLFDENILNKINFFTTHTSTVIYYANHINWQAVMMMVVSVLDFNWDSNWQGNVWIKSGLLNEDAFFLRPHINDDVVIPIKIIDVVFRIDKSCNWLIIKIIWIV